MKNSRYNTEILPSTAQQTTSKGQILRKPWVRAVSRPSWITQKKLNANVEEMFHRIIAMVKQHHLIAGECYFERDYKHDSSGYLAMHTFLTNSLYLYLECRLTFDYYIEYDFCNCKYEAEVIKLLQHYPLDMRSERVHLSPDFPTYYTRTLNYQLPEHVHSFKS